MTKSSIQQSQTTTQKQQELSLRWILAFDQQHYQHSRVNFTDLDSTYSKIATHSGLDDVPPISEGSKKLNDGVVPPAAPNDQAGVAGLSDADVVAGVDVGVPSEGCLSLVKIIVSALVVEMYEARSYTHAIE
jgi:hypothetical protein